MFEGYSLAYSAAATREQAAQLFSNAILETTMAVYIGDTRVNDTSLTGKGSTVGGKYFKLETVTGELVKVPYVDFAGTYADLDPDDTLATVAVPVEGKEDPNTNFFAFDVSADLLNQEVTVVYKETNNTSLDSKDTVYDVYAHRRFQGLRDHDGCHHPGRQRRRQADR